MDYPIWDLAMGGGVLIGRVAILHVVVSHFAVGGGIVIAVLETLAVTRGERSLRELARRSSTMLILVSTVFGAISGVGIWFTIGARAPRGHVVADPHLRLGVGDRVGVLPPRGRHGAPVPRHVGHGRGRGRTS